MKNSLLIALGLLAIGCSQTSPVAETATKPDAPTATTPVATSAPAATASVSKDPAPQVNTDPRTGADPDRINQLKDLKVATISANGHKIKVWLMDNESKRAEGMMFLKDKDVHNDEGMLFLFPDLQPNDGRHGFWMHNCPLGLDICYIGHDKKVLNIADGKPYDETSLPPAGDYQYVLEMKTNCAKKLGIKKGTPVTISDTLKGF